MWKGHIQAASQWVIEYLASFHHIERKTGFGLVWALKTKGQGAFMQLLCSWSWRVCKPQKRHQNRKGAHSSCFRKTNHQRQRQYKAWQSLHSADYGAFRSLHPAGIIEGPDAVACHSWCWFLTISLSSGPHITASENFYFRKGRRKELSVSPWNVAWQALQRSWFSGKIMRKSATCSLPGAV